MLHPFSSRTLGTGHRTRSSAAHAGSERRPAELTTAIAWYLFACGIASYMLLSPQILFHLGIPYDAPGGPIFVKVHPGSWLILFGYTLLLMARGNPLRVGAATLASEPLLGVYVACQGIVLLWLVIRHGGSGATNVVLLRTSIKS